jgi:hypothetical protein
MFRAVTLILIYHRHKPVDSIYAGRIAGKCFTSLAMGLSQHYPHEISHLRSTELDAIGLHDVT